MDAMKMWLLLLTGCALCLYAVWRSDATIIPTIWLPYPLPFGF